jgi:gamma-glutamyltranspeptidase/glutathione hydrolase
MTRTQTATTKTARRARGDARARRALSSDAGAEGAADACLAAGGGALEAVIAGFFAAAAVHPGVLLSPVSVLLGGVGEGGHFFDGRPRQPGLGAKRPRGFEDPNAVPAAARVAVPASLTSVLFAHAYARSKSLRSLVEPAAALARRSGAVRRAALLERIAEVGAAALAEPAYRRPLLRLGSASEGGLMTPRDLEPPELRAEPLAERMLAGESFRVVPGNAGSSARAAAVLACDALGVFAALAYRPLEPGIALEELEVLAPDCAVPVLRGVPRVTPGSALGAGFALGLRLDERTRPVELVFDASSGELGEARADAPRLLVRRDPDQRVVTTARR